MKANNDDWTVSVHRLKISSNWANIIAKKEIALDIKIENSAIKSKIVGNKCLFTDYLIRHLKPSGLKIKTQLASLKSDNMLLDLDLEEKNIQISSKASFMCKQKNSTLQATAGISEGYITYNDFKLHAIFGNATGTLDIHDPKNINSNFKIYFKTPHANHTLSGKTENSRLFAKLKGDSGTIFLNGTLFSDEHITRLSPELSVEAHDLLIYNYRLDLLKITLKKDNEITGNFTLKNGDVKLDGFLSLDDENKFDLATHNPEDIFLPINKFCIKSGGLNLRVNSKNMRDFKSGLKINLQDAQENLITIDSVVKANSEEVVADGNINSLNFHANYNNKSQSQDFKICDKNNNVLLDFNLSKNIINALINSDLIKYVDTRAAKLLIGKTNIKINAGFTKNNQIKGVLNAGNCSLMIPNSYSIITDLNTQFKIDLKTHQLNLKNSVIKLNKGEIESKASKIIFGKIGAINYLSIPLIIKGLTLNLNKEVVAAFSASLILQKTGCEALPANGDIVIQNLFLKDMDNLFSSKPNAPKNTNKLPININLNITSKKPIPFKNDQIEFKALINLQARGLLGEQELSGHIDMISGKVKFPYKNLKIAAGKINIGNKETVLDITAKNKIKKYRINAHIHGNAKNPNITLSSIPYLSERQIGSLLISGSENSLNIMVPTIFMQNIQNLFYKNSNNKSITPEVKSLKPLKRVKLISRIDELNEHIIKGGVEIDLSDKISASIEKNLDLNEKTTIELDYAPSDDINIKGLKDENGDLSGEVEFRWRF